MTHLDLCGLVSLVIAGGLLIVLTLGLLNVLLNLGTLVLKVANLALKLANVAVLVDPPLLSD